MQDEIKKIRKTYYAIVLPGLIILLALNILRKYCGYSMSMGLTSQAVSLIFVILAVMSAFIIPMLIRNLKSKGGKINGENLAGFQKKILFISLPSLYIAILGYIIPLPKGPGIIVTISALFAMYYFFPSDSRIAKDKRKFGING